MSKAAYKALLEKLSESILLCTGLDFTNDREAALQRAMRNAAAKLGFDDPLLYCKWILEDPVGEDRLQSLIEYITVGETHFFRDKNFYHVLEERILPELIRSRWNSQRSLRIWSAGCATGEEPYSIAILVQKLIPDLSFWQLDLVGTDINREFLRKATEGNYNQWSFRGVPKSVQRTYFHKNGDGYNILADIKRMVKFFELNLNREVFPCLPDIMTNWNMILCRNVLMYFAPEYQQKVIDKLTMRLAEGGLLILSPAELSIVNSANLVSDTIDGVVIHRKVTPGISVRTESQCFPVVQELPNPDIQKPSPDYVFPAQISVTAAKPQKIQESVETVYEKALELFYQGAYSDVIEMLRKCLKNEDFPDQKSSSAMLLVARAYANQRKLDEALKWTQQVMGTDKLNSDAHYLEGIILQEKDDLKGALLSLKRALFLDPELRSCPFCFREFGDAARKIKRVKKTFQDNSGYFGRLF